MMIKAYSVYDKQSASYSLPMFARDDQDMVQTLLWFIDNGSGARWQANPHDFVLYRIGEFDQLVCQFVMAPLVPVAELAQLRTMKDRFEESSGQLDLEDVVNG